MDADWTCGCSGGVAAGNIHAALGLEHDCDSVHGVHLQGRTRLGHQHHAAGVQRIVFGKRLDWCRPRINRPSNVRGHVAARCHSDLHRGHLGGWTPNRESRNEHKFGNAGFSDSLPGCSRPGMVPTVDSGGLHVRHELQHDGPTAITDHQAAKGSHARARIHIGDHSSAGLPRQPQTSTHRLV